MEDWEEKDIHEAVLKMTRKKKRVGGFTTGIKTEAEYLSK